MVYHQIYSSNILEGAKSVTQKVLTYIIPRKRKRKNGHRVARELAGFIWAITQEGKDVPTT